MSLASLAEADPGFSRVHQAFVLPSIEKTKWKYNIINNLIHGEKAPSEPTNSPKFQFVRKVRHEKHVFLSHINILPWKQKVRTNISIIKDSLRGGGIIASKEGSMGQVYTETFLCLTSWVPFYAYETPENKKASQCLLLWIFFMRCNYTKYFYCYRL